MRRTLAETFATVAASTVGEHAVADFERERPDIVVLAFHTLEKSQQFCLGLLRFCKLAQIHPHRYAILCSGADMGAAYGLCRKGFFDDYVPYWPQAHDGHRLAMAVWSTARALAATRDVAPSPAESLAHAENARSIGELVSRRIDEGQHHVATLKASIGRIADEVGPAGSEGVHRAIAASHAGIEPMADWAKAFRADVGPHVTDAKALAARLTPPSTIFVVEDDPFAAKLIGKALEPRIRVEIATDGESLFELLRRTRPRAILMDINLPGTSGLDLAEWLRASPSLSDIPVLMLTGTATHETIARSKAVGACDFIVKPFTRDALLAKLERHMR